MQSDGDHLDGVIQDVYEAGLDRSRWTHALDHIRSRFGIAACGVTWRRADGVEQIWTGLEPSFERDYVAHFHAYDPWVEAGSKLEAGRCLIGHEAIPLDQLRRTEFYTDLLRPHGLLDLLGGFVDRRPGLDLSFAMMPHASHQIPARQVARDVERLMPHVRQAERIGRRIAVAEQVEATLLDRLDRASIAAFVVDADQQLLSHNTRGEDLLRAGGYFKVAGRKLVPVSTSPRGSELLPALVSSALQTARGGGTTPVPSVVRPHAPSAGAAPLVVTAVPLRGPAASRQHGTDEPCALILALVPSATSASPSLVSALEAAYGLSPAQARVAALVGTGLAPRDAAERLGISEGTVRFQLKQIYSKLAIDGQRGLVAITQALSHFVPATE